MLSRRLTLAVAILLAVGMQGPRAFAQGSDGRISGVVADASGAARPGATVTITNQATNATKR